MIRATQHAEDTLARHKVEGGYHIITAQSHPRMFKAFEMISHDAGFGAGHTTYSVPTTYTADNLLAIETILAAIPENKFEDFCIGGSEFRDIAPDANDFLDHFANDWEDEL